MGWEVGREWGKLSSSRNPGAGHIAEASPGRPEWEVESTEAGAGAPLSYWGLHTGMCHQGPGLAQPRVCGPRVSVSTTGVLVESAGPRAPSQTCGIRDSGAEAQQPVLSQAPRPWNQRATGTCRAQAPQRCTESTGRCSWRLHCVCRGPRSHRRATSDGSHHPSDLMHV